MIFSLHRKLRPKVYFPSYLETKIQRGAHFEFVSGNFSTSFAEIWRECYPIIRQKNYVGEFLFFACFKSYCYFSEENVCFIKTQSLTACQKQTRQVIKISRHGLFEEGVKKTNLISEPLYFGK